MSQKYTMPNRAFYRDGHYYKPGEPFEIADGTVPPHDALTHPGGDPAWDQEKWDKHAAVRLENKKKMAEASGAGVLLGFKPVFPKKEPKAKETDKQPDTMSGMQGAHKSAADRK